jgi:hypothetical protein
VHVREDCRNGANIAARFGWQFCFPHHRVKVFDKNLVDAIVGGKNLRGGSPVLSVSLV